MSLSYSVLNFGGLVHLIYDAPRRFVASSYDCITSCNERNIPPSFLMLSGLVPEGGGLKGAWHQRLTCCLSPNLVSAYLFRIYVFLKTNFVLVQKSQFVLEHHHVNITLNTSIQWQIKNVMVNKNIFLKQLRCFRQINRLDKQLLSRLHSSSSALLATLIITSDAVQVSGFNLLNYIIGVNNIVFILGRFHCQQSGYQDTSFNEINII